VTFHAAAAVTVRNADPLALRSACENIIRNAIRFTQRGTAVRVDLEMAKGVPGEQVLLFVRDQGPGVPEESLGSIFQPFVRVVRNADPAEGSGLGLAIACEAIRLHHGSIVASNLQPAGLEISVRLPVGA
jgi:signal transduction histidine kinase